MNSSTKISLGEFLNKKTFLYWNVPNLDPLKNKENILGRFQYKNGFCTGIYPTLIPYKTIKTALGSKSQTP